MPFMRPNQLALLGLMVAAASAHAATPVRSVPSIDLKRYVGTWHEIARLPMFFERQCRRNVTATYELNEDGSLGVHNACTRKDGTRIASDGVARLADSGLKPAELQVRFAPGWLSWLPLVWANYWVIALDEDHYQWAMVGEPRRRYLWILSREPSMDRATFAALRARAHDMGYDLSPLIVSAQID
jgi:apolipoprotein D and lipocalin family protein